MEFTLTWYEFLILLGVILVTPCFFLDLGIFKKGHRLTFSFLLSAFIVEFIGGNLARNGIHNIWFYNIFWILGLIVLILLFLRSTLAIHYKSKVFLLPIGVYLLIWGSNLAFFQPIESFFKVPYVLACLIILAMCIFFYHGIIFRDHFLETRLATNPFFWTINMYFAYFSATLLFYASYDFLLVMDTSSFAFLNKMIRVLGVCMYLVLGISFYLPFLKRKEGSS